MKNRHKAAAAATISAMSVTLLASAPAVNAAQYVIDDFDGADNQTLQAGSLGDGPTVVGTTYTAGGPTDDDFVVTPSVDVAGGSGLNLALLSIPGNGTPIFGSAVDTGALGGFTSAKWTLAYDTPALPTVDVEAELGGPVAEIAINLAFFSGDADFTITFDDGSGPADSDTVNVTAGGLVVFDLNEFANTDFTTIKGVTVEVETALPGTQFAIEQELILDTVTNIIPTPAAAGAGLVCLTGLMARRRRI